jgi:hypothetical protein
MMVKRTGMIGWIASGHGSLEDGFLDFSVGRGKCARDDRSADPAEGRFGMFAALLPRECILCSSVAGVLIGFRALIEFSG